LEKHLTAIDQQARNGIRVVVLRLKRVRNPDAVCLSLIDGFLKRMEKRRVTVLVCGVRPELARVLHSTHLDERLGPKCIFHEAASVWSSTLDAVRHAYDLLQGDVCATCPRRAEAGPGQEPLYYMI
jgi:SulP family sulfate permease